MKRLLLLLLASLLLAGPALAEVSGSDVRDEFNKLNSVDRAEMALEIAKKVEAAKAPGFTGVLPNVKVDDVEPWLKLIDHMGNGLVSLAEKLGVTANQLLTTPVGLISVGLIAYHVMGPEILDIFLSFIWFAITMPFLLLFFFKSVIPIKEYTTIEKKTWRGTATVQKPLRRQMVFDDDEGFNVDWVFVILVAINVFITLVIMA